MSVAGLSLAAAVLLFQIGAASPGTPGVCKAPCDEESGPAQAPVEAQEVEPGTPVAVDTEAEHTGAPVAAESRLLPDRMRVPATRGGIRVARGALGYRVPLVVKQHVPARIRGGVYMLAHETYVVLRPGYWEAPGDAEDPATVSKPTETQQPEVAEGCWLRRLFRKLGRCDGGP